MNETQWHASEAFWIARPQATPDWAWEKRLNGRGKRVRYQGFLDVPLLVCQPNRLEYCQRRI
jgi:hypothetical protein